MDAKKKPLINADDGLKAIFGGKKLRVTLCEETEITLGAELAKEFLS
jgi:hypothetical protein